MKFISQKKNCRNLDNLPIYGDCCICSTWGKVKEYKGKLYCTIHLQRETESGANRKQSDRKEKFLNALSIAKEEVQIS